MRCLLCLLVFLLFCLLVFGSFVSNCCFIIVWARIENVCQFYGFCVCVSTAEAIKKIEEWPCRPLKVVMFDFDTVVLVIQPLIFLVFVSDGWWKFDATTSCNNGVSWQADATSGGYGGDGFRWLVFRGRLEECFWWWKGFMTWLVRFWIFLLIIQLSVVTRVSCIGFWTC